MNDITERTHLHVSTEVKSVVDEVHQKSKIQIGKITDESLLYGLRIKYRKYLSEETLTKLSNNNGKHN